MINTFYSISLILLQNSQTRQTPDHFLAATYEYFRLQITRLNPAEATLEPVLVDKQRK